MLKYRRLRVREQGNADLNTQHCSSFDLLIRSSCRWTLSRTLVILCACRNCSATQEIDTIAQTVELSPTCHFSRQAGLRTFPYPSDSVDTTTNIRATTPLLSLLLARASVMLPSGAIALPSW